MKLVKSLKTKRSNVFIYDTEQMFFNESIFCVTAREFDSEQIVVRFASETQIDDVLNTLK